MNRQFHKIVYYYKILPSNYHNRVSEAEAASLFKTEFEVGARISIQIFTVPTGQLTSSPTSSKEDSD